MKTWTKLLAMTLSIMLLGAVSFAAAERKPTVTVLLSSGSAQLPPG